MTTATIQISLDSKTAQAYQATPEEKRQRIRRLISFLLREFIESSPASLLALMDDITQEAKSKGLTPEILETLLGDE